MEGRRDYSLPPNRPLFPLPPSVFIASLARIWTLVFPWLAESRMVTFRCVKWKIVALHAKQAVADVATPATYI